MAIITCEKCGKKYSDKAPECPNCAKNKTDANSVSPIRIISLIFIVVLIFFIGTSLPRSEKKEKRSTKPTPFMAYYQSQQFAKKYLKSPASAEFPPLHEARVKEIKHGEYIVLSYVDAKNAFGAMIRESYSCQLKTADGDTWQLVNFAFATQ